MRVELLPVGHLYVSDEDPFLLDPWPSVTQILGEQEEYRKAYRWSTPYALSLGTAVHVACDLDDTGVLDPRTVAPVVQPYLEAWRRCRREMGLRVVSSERTVWVPGPDRYAGTLDRLCARAHTDALYLLDLKTGAPSNGARLAGPQTAGYLQALQSAADAPPSPIHRGSVHLGADGAYTLVGHNDPRDLDRFNFARRDYYWRRTCPTTRLA